MTVPQPARHQGTHRLIGVHPDAHPLLTQLDPEPLRAEADRLAGARRSAEERVLTAFAAAQDRASLRAQLRGSAAQARAQGRAAR